MDDLGLWEPYAGPEARAPRLRVHDGDAFRDVTAAAWHEAALAKGGGLRRLGVSPGTRVACVLTNTFDVCATIFGIWLAGGVVVSLPTPARGMELDRYAAQLRRLVRHAEAELVLVDAEFEEALAQLLGENPDVRVHAFEATGSAPLRDPSPPGRDDLAFVQYSSGSTSEPKGCMLSAGAISRHMAMLAEVLEIDPAVDQGVTWLPLSHDMGLFGCLLLSWSKGMSLALSSPQRFLSSPRTWLEDCGDVQATITAGPNFGLHLAARTARGVRLEPFPMRKWVVGGERVEWSTLRAAREALEPLGVPFTAFLPAYGLAEAVLAVTMLRLDEKPTARDVAIAGDRDGGPARTATLSSVGRPLRGVDVEIRDADAAGLGEIVVRSPSLAGGYLANPELTAERFVDGAVRTLDLGVLGEHGELYVAGRLDDMISIGGRKIFARDVEQALESAAPVRPGGGVLVDAEAAGGRRLVVLAEPDRGATDFGAIARVVRELTSARLGVRLDDCIVVPRGTIPKTPSGKVQRYRCRELIEQGELEPLAATGS